MLNSLRGLQLEKEYNVIIDELFTYLVSHVSNQQENK